MLKFNLMKKELKVIICAGLTTLTLLAAAGVTLVLIARSI